MSRAPKYAAPVPKYCLLDLKVAADDQAARFFKKQGCTEIHTFGDVKLILGYIASAFAFTDFYFTWKKDFQKVKHITLICVSSYFVLTGLLFLWMTFVVGKTCYQGVTANKEGHFKMSSVHILDEGYQPIYKITVEYSPSVSGPPITHKAEASIPFASFVDDLGRISIATFDEQLAQIVNKVRPTKKDQ
ncbi:hypothetical protein DSO57_1003414 [Entomophthora muscae]|uniref:Uncharacterized protein n=2 Tax=Entomophthora muscae TaxID=34485 RepID=A0ACC2TJI1_9FUNG|nr:hypothetical protein DSO57_1035963 [Entomophthora muscae]KAJ9074759.1 hypothetical protein DSO57_1003414 [Entomophthora muscae]